jgi:hypothetical protein
LPSQGLKENTVYDLESGIGCGPFASIKGVYFLCNCREGIEGSID